jgi:7-carboxy-7-deazaguanine synthase
VNKQPIEKRQLFPDGELAVHSIFLTIQGEGPFCGVPCVFVRLAGCNLQCPACDTDYTSTRKQMGPYEILGEINELWRKERYREGLVVITGGEPFRQNIGPLCELLLSNRYYVQIETNGTLAPLPLRYRFDPAMRQGVYVVCSPKTGKIHEGIYAVACALKYVVRHGQVDTDGLPLHALDHPAYPARPPEGWSRPIYVQPLDSQNVLDNDLHTAEAVASCIKHGYTLQLQIHKLVGVE